MGAPGTGGLVFSDRVVQIRCIRIDASADVGGLTMPDQLQMVYIIPAADGCRIATAHYYIVGAEGFGRRFACMMHTLSVID